MKELYLVGLSHKTAPVEWRERLALPPDAVASLARRLREKGVGEVIALSTCNRVELYAVSEGDGVPALLRQFLLEAHQDGRLGQCFYEQRGPGAVRHLFRVAAGLDSLVVGESEILGQVKKSYEQAAAGEGTGKLTNVLFQRALFVGKKVRTATGISEGPTSVPALAASLAGRIFGNLRESRILIVGAGEMAEGTLHALLSQKAGAVTVVNRTLEKAEALAKAFNARARPMDALAAELDQADVVLCSTGAPEPVVTRAMVEAALHRRKNRPLFFIDIAVPRDVDPSVETLDHVYLYNVDDLESLVAETLVKRRGEIEKAQALADDLAARFEPWYAAWRAGDTAALKHHPRAEPAA